MKKYLINSINNINTANFSTTFAKSIEKEKKVLLISLLRKETNIEDFFENDGMITYDLADYFLGYTQKNKIITKVNDNIDIILSPLIEEKFKPDKKNLQDLLEDLDYEFIIFDGADFSLFDDGIKVFATDENLVMEDSDYFYIDNVDSYFSDRKKFIEINGITSKYLGFNKKNDDYTEIVQNLLSESEKKVSKLSFFEKLKEKFGK
ncbi:MAG: hypothetical protein SOZ89_04210 [Peptoniphilaceae bacterium]|nr:hypothetical protein [Peptoniphilaceae bacterium]MDD7383319.1 hypothetical protein [Peptoniphilaceae bacterium]MDY3738310.1 hypothetical protein [Peptoniphilaceae bacterium]